MIYSRAVALRIYTNKLRLHKAPDSDHLGVLVYSFGDASYACVFPFGVVVFWNVPMIKQKQFMVDVMEFARMPLEVQITEEYQLSVGKRDDIDLGKIYLQSLEPLDVVSLSFLFAQSVVLTRMEQDADDQLYQLNHILRPIEKTGKIKLRRKELLKKLGLVLRDRTHSFYEFGFDSTPAAAWDDTRREVMHKELKDALNINPRMRQNDNKWKMISEEMQFVLTLVTEREDLHIELLLVIFGLTIDIFLTIWQILEESGGVRQLFL